MRVLPRLVAAAAVAIGLLAACSMDDPTNRFAQLTYQHRPDIGLDVGEIQIEQAYLTPGQPPNVDHLFPVQPKDAAVRWAQRSEEHTSELQSLMSISYAVFCLKKKKIKA